MEKPSPFGALTNEVRRMLLNACRCKLSQMPIARSLGTSHEHPASSDDQQSNWMLIYSKPSEVRSGLLRPVQGIRLVDVHDAPIEVRGS